MKIEYATGIIIAKAAMSIHSSIGQPVKSQRAPARLGAGPDALRQLNRGSGSSTSTVAQTRLTKSEGAAPGTAFGSHFDLAASTRCVRRCGVPNKTSLVNQPDDDPGDSSHEDIAGEQRPRRKSAQLFFVVAIEAGKLLLDMRQNRRPRAGPGGGCGRPANAKKAISTGRDSNESSGRP
jgi:hypothetical protein